MGALLTQPYPFSDSKNRKWITLLGMGLFVFLFLFSFRPFGLYALSESSAILILAGYGLACSLVLFINLIVIPTLFPAIFNEEGWTVLKEILYILFNIGAVGVANTLYTNWQFNDRITMVYFIRFQIITLLVAILPIITIVLIKQVTLLRRNLAESQALTNSMNHKKRLDTLKSAKITLSAENIRDNFTIAVNDLMFINAANNYIEVTYLEMGEVKKKLLRSTLKIARNDLRNFTAFYRCHRAWIVNLDKVIAISGNSQGYRLKIENSKLLIPVSRNLNTEIGQRLAK